MTVSMLARAEPLDINTASEAQLDEVLVGVGKTKARAIIEDRQKNGLYSSVDDLERVKGIGPATIAKNRSRITVLAQGRTPELKSRNPQPASPPATAARTLAAPPAPPADGQPAQLKNPNQ